MLSQRIFLKREGGHGKSVKKAKGQEEEITGSVEQNCGYQKAQGEKDVRRIEYP